MLADEWNGQTRWFITDQIGSVRDLVSDSAVVINHYRYDSFGTVLSQTNPSADNDILYSGREYQSGIGYFRARYYSPNIGRFQQEDLLSPYGYDYTGNNPVTLTDGLRLTVGIEELFLKAKQSNAFIILSCLILFLESTKLSLLMLLLVALTMG